MTDNPNEATPAFDQTNGLVDGLEGDDGGAENDDTTAAGGVSGTLLHDLEDGQTSEQTYDTTRGDDDSSDGYVEPVDDGAATGYSEEGHP